MKIFCVECNKDVEPKLVTGAMVYPTCAKVAQDKYWMCNSCKNFVGCHKNANKNKLRPLGIIANKELRQARIQIHKIIDPIWQKERMKRGEVYALISSELGYQFHTAELRNLEEVNRVHEIAQGLQKYV